MLLKNLIRIISSYKFSIITIIFFELLYLVKGHKGNRFNFSNNDLMADNLPCPYYFLFKIKKTLKENNFRNFLDLGCGSGRAIDFFNKNFFNKTFIGIEYFTNQFEYCKKVFQERKNIKIIQADFTKTDFFQYDADWSVSLIGDKEIYFAQLSLHLLSTRNVDQKIQQMMYYLLDETSYWSKAKTPEEEVTEVNVNQADEVLRWATNGGIE